jgi:hypothetical protein
VRKTEPDQAVDLRAMAAERFPLIPRAKPVCRALEARVARVRERAALAGQHTDKSLVLAAEAQNLAALIMSDCGLPDLARDLCWQQFEVFLTVGPRNAAMTKLALQPLINLSRLLIRDGHGDAAYQLLEALFHGIESRGDAVIEGRKIRLADLVSHDDDHREVVQWMWSVLLADGTRALTRAGRWAEAVRRAQQNKGIGDRLLDGRQVAILARCQAGDHDKAVRLLADSSTPTPWEKAVAACMRVLCGRLAHRPSDSDVATMMDRYLGLKPAPEHVVFQVRLGLCVIDVAAGDRRVPQVADVLVCHALGAADAYAARDALSHETCLAHTTADASQALTEIVRASGLVTSSDLGTVALQGPLLDSLINSAQAAKEALATSMLSTTR